MYAMIELMYIALLTLHVLVSVFLTLMITAVLVSAAMSRKTRSHAVMWGSFAATSISGLALIFVSPAGLGRFCAMMTAFSLLTLVAHQVYRRRVLATAEV